MIKINNLLPASFIFFSSLFTDLAAAWLFSLPLAETPEILTYRLLMAILYSGFAIIVIAYDKRK